MVKIIERNFDSWTQLVNYIDITFTFFKNYTFRGHADAVWKLESTLTRALNKIDTDIDKNILVAMHLAGFKQNLRGRSKQNLNDISENELYAIGQHFGLHTPLLDLTHSPYVALFFAFQGNSASGKRCLWAIHDHIIGEVNDSQTIMKNKIESVKPLSNDNPRLVSQQGMFLKLPIDSSLEALVEKIQKEQTGNLIYKITVSDSMREDVLASLNNMNINNLTLFPDLIGSSLHTNYALEFYPYSRKKQKEVWEKHRLKNGEK